MKFLFNSLFTLGITFFFGQMGSAQVITQSDESANYLARQIEFSSGFRAANYASYAKGLARTLSLLSPAQQAEVFGVGASANSMAMAGGSNLETSSPEGGSESEGGTDSDDETESTGSVLADVLAGADNSSGSSGSTSGDSGASPSISTGSGGSVASASGSSSSGSTTVSSSSSSSGDSPASATGSTAGSPASSGGGNWWDSVSNFIQALLNVVKKFMGVGPV